MRPRLLGLCLVALVLSAPALADKSPPVTTPQPFTGYEQALKLMDKGKCDAARELLAPNSVFRPGEEVALSDIGNCYLKSADKETDPAEARRLRETGAGWILHAANVGLRTAQEDAVRLYLDGKVFFIDPYEAGKWYMLWQVNRSQMQLGLIEFDHELQKKLSATVTEEQWAEAKARAAKWKPIASGQSPL